MLSEVPARKYRIERYLAEGGMGAIYLGKRLGPVGFEKEVVLKQLLPEFTTRPEFRDLFFREAKISASLDHVNIVRTFDLAKFDDSLFIVMEYVRGADLRTISWRARLKRRALSPAAVLHVAMEVLAGLAYAHARRSERGDALGIIHRDVSPSNILCSAQGEVKLSDFGIAKAVTFSSVFYRVRGKVGYMSPEQARSQPLDARSDLFSLAVCIFETLTGERLYAGDLQTPPDEIYAQRVPSLVQKCPELPLELEPVMRKALALDPDQRFQDAESFGHALRQVARRHGLLYSAPALAAELEAVLGPRVEVWFTDESAVSLVTAKMQVPSLEGQEAASMALDPDDEPDPPVAPPRARPTPPAPSPVASSSPVIPAPPPWSYPADLSPPAALTDAAAGGPQTTPRSPSSPVRVLLADARAQRARSARRRWLLMSAAVVLGGLAALGLGRLLSPPPAPALDVPPAGHAAWR